MRWLALLAAAFAATAIPGSRLGVNVAIVGVAAAAAIAISARRSFDSICFGGLALALAFVPVLLDATWVVLVCLGLAGVLAACAVAGPRLLAPIAPVRALGAAPELMPSPPQHAAPALRGFGFGVVLVAPFALLFWTADAAFAELGRRTPLPSVASLPERALVFAFVLALVLGLALTRPGLVPSVAFRRPKLSPSEWAIPLALLDALVLVFVAVQVTVLFGGRDHVLETTGLTYAEYARQGFWQLLAAAALTLVVVGAAMRFADVRNDGQQRLLKALLGTLCLLTIVIVASALHRLGLYEAAFGLTRPRLAAETAAWALGGFFVLLVLAGAVPVARTHHARVALVGAATGLLALSISNPDARIAERNIERWRATGDLDVGYLRGLSADAVPALASLPEPLRSDALVGIRARLASPDSWTSANVSRHRARELLAEPG